MVDDIAQMEFFEDDRPVGYRFCHCEIVLDGQAPVRPAEEADVAVEPVAAIESVWALMKGAFKTRIDLRYRVAFTDELCSLHDEKWRHIIS